jgi:hypothetical protein
MKSFSFWQKNSDSSLGQGDFIFNCPVPIFAEIPAEKSKITPKVKVYNLIVVTQSCDLANGKVPFVALCPIYSLSEFEESNPKAAQKGFWEQVRKGKIEGLHLLSPFENPENNRNCFVVDFREIYSLPFEFSSKHAGSLETRWRLQSPYLKHFSQAFARFFMRVGLPSNISPFK